MTEKVNPGRGRAREERGETQSREGIREETKRSRGVCGDVLTLGTSDLLSAMIYNGINFLKTFVARDIPVLPRTIRPQVIRPRVKAVGRLISLNK